MIKELKYYPAITWSPFGNMFIFIAQHNQVNNVFLAVINYNKTEQNIEYSILQLTNNKEEDFFYYDPQWSPDGKQLAFTKIDMGDQSQVFIYDFKEMKLIQIGENHNIRNFRFCKKNKDREGAFFVVKENVNYYCYYNEKYMDSKFDKMMNKIPGIILKNPYIYADFAEYDTKIAIININEISTLYVYDYDLFRTINFTIDNATNLPGWEYNPTMNPIWLYNDSVLLFLAENGIYSCFVSDENLKKGELNFKRVLEAKYTNALSKDIDNKFYYSSQKSNDFIITQFDLNLRDEPKEQTLEEVYYKVKIIEYDENSHIAKIKRERKPTPEKMVVNKSGDGYIQKEHQTKNNKWKKNSGFLCIYSDTKDKFEVNNELILIWPKILKSKTINIKVNFLEQTSQEKDARKYDY